MIEIYVDSKVKSPNEMNGILKGLRFKKQFVPGQSTFLKDREFEALMAEDESPLNFMIESGQYIKKEGPKSVKSKLELAEEGVENAEQALADAKDKEEQKKASVALKQAKEELKQLIKAEKKGK